MTRYALCIEGSFLSKSMCTLFVFKIQQKGGTSEGFQMWYALPAARRMEAPSYHDLRSGAYPIVEAGGLVVRALIGSYVPSADAGRVRHSSPFDESLMKTPLTLLDVKLAPGATFSHLAPPSDSLLAYCFRGQCAVAGRQVGLYQCALLAHDGETLEIANEGSAETRLLVLQGSFTSS